MRVLVRHGHFAFFPKTAKEVAKFASYFDQDLVRVDDYYTFESLAELPRYSIMIKPFGNLPAITTYEGRGPWEVMRENDFVYNVGLKLLVPKLAVVGMVTLLRSDAYMICPTPLYQPGMRDASGRQILSYDGEYMPENFQLKIREVSYE